MTRGARRLARRLMLAVALVCAIPGLAHAAPVKVSLTFDDGTSDHVQAAQILSSHGLPGVFYINSSRMGMSGYLTTAQALQMQAAGHEIAGHTVSHANLPTIDEAEQRRQVCNDRVALTNLGFRVTSFAYPFGADSALTKQIVFDCGYNSARDVGGIVSPTGCAGCATAESLPPRDLFSVRTPDSVKVDTTLQQLQNSVELARANGGGWVPIVFHRICEGCVTTSVSATVLDQLAAWLAAQATNDVTVVTVDEMIGGTVKPPVAGPAPGPPRTGNMLLNPQLTTIGVDGTTPTCWQHGGYGTNTTAWSMITTGHGDTTAQRLSVSSFTSGDARFISRWDLGTCAPTVAAAHSYTARLWYQATANARVVIYYRTSLGGWVYWKGGSQLPVASAWTQASLSTGTLPADATALSVGLSVRSTGTVTVDDLSLTDDAGTTDTTAPTTTMTCTPGPCPTATWSKVAQTVALSTSDTGGSGVTVTRFTTDGTEPTTTNGAIYSSPLTITDRTTLKFRSWDGAGNAEVTRTAVLQVDTKAPFNVAITAPAQGATVTGITAITTVSNDDVGVVRTRFFIDGVFVGSRTKLPMKWNWNTSTVSPGTHVLQVSVLDAAGNTTFSDVVVVTK